MQGDEDNMQFEDWKSKEPEKYILTRKYHECASIIGECYNNPTEFKIKFAFSAIMDYLISMPVLMDFNKTPVVGEKKKQFDNFRDQSLAKMDDLSFILYGADSERLRKLLHDRGMARRRVNANNIKWTYKLTNLPVLVHELRQILVEAGAWATAAGLRVSIHATRKFGLDKMMGEENFIDLKISGFDEGN